MSAVKDLLLSTVEATMRERGIDIADGDAFDAIQDEILNATECGYSQSPYTHTGFECGAL